MLLLACEVEPSDSGDSVPVDSEVEQPHHPDAELTSDEAGAQLKEAVRFGLPTAIGIVDAYEGLMSAGDSTCPGEGFSSGWLEVFLAEGCESTSGIWYQGAAGGSSDPLDDDMNGSTDGFGYRFKGDATIIDANGFTFKMGGYTELNLYTSQGDGYAFDGEFYGSYSYPGAPQPWLQQGVSAALDIAGTLVTPEEFEISVNGGFGTDDQAVFATEFVIGGACAEMPSGTIGFRDDRGYWYDLTFDETTCDGCGDVLFDGRESLGVGCADVVEAFRSSIFEMDDALHANGFE